MKHKKVKSMKILAFSLVFTLTIGLTPDMTSAQSWKESWNKFKRNASENLRRSAEKARQNWERSRPQRERLYNKTRQTLHKTYQQSQRNWERTIKPKVERDLRKFRSTAERKSYEFRRRAEDYIQRQRQNPELQRKMRRLYEDVAPRVVEKISTTSRRYGTKVASDLADFYARYGESAGNKLRDDLLRFEDTSRKTIVEFYSRYGPQVGAAIKRTVDKHGPVVARKLQEAYRRHGPEIGNRIRYVYDKWSLKVANDIKQTYDAYGPVIGERIRTTYEKFGQEIGEKIRYEYLPAIRRNVSDPENQEKAIIVAGSVHKFIKNIRPAAREKLYHSLSVLSEMRIPTKYGGTTVREQYRKFIKKHIPGLVGTDFEDPAKVATVGIELIVVFHFTGGIAAEPVFEDLKILPGENGDVVSMKEKLYEISPTDPEQMIATLDLMSDIEQVLDKDVEVEDITAAANLVKTGIETYENSQASSS